MPFNGLKARFHVQLFNKLNTRYIQVIFWLLLLRYMKSILAILVHLLFFGLVQSKRRYLVKVAGNKSLHEAHHGNKAKHYLVEVAGSTSLPRVHHGNKRRRGKTDKKKEMKRERKGRGDKGRKKDYQDILEVKGSASNHGSGEDQTTKSLPTFTT